ncbi:MAG: hypothetical protein LBQ88_15915 [Treponema sp.]|jgi:hypothetical protein|nr:hypothetical protein [Treponema sp.]
MKDFQKIDWKLYNRPPFYQQWLCREDTLKLASFGDKGLAEVDDQILALKDQWDIDNVKGALLDRMGKILAEPRNGNNDEMYRLFLKLRTMLNTTSGSVNDVIKVIKFLYSSEIVHIVPDYPAGLIILHDGEGPDINFNAIIKQVVGAGIDYSTKELFYFNEELPASETVSKMKSGTSMTDSMAYVFHNGVYRRNGQIRRRYNGVHDQLSLKIGYSLQDRLLGRSLHNSLFHRNGTLTHSGFANDVATELWSFNGRMDYEENVQSSEKTAISLSYHLSDGMEQDFRRNGKLRRNGEVQHKTCHILDRINLKIVNHIQESHRGQAIHNGLYKRDGTITHGLLNTSITEKNNIHVKYKLQDTVQSSEEVSPVSIHHSISEGFHRKIHRNGLIKRNGQYNRAINVVDVQKINVHVSPFTDTVTCSESMTIWYRKHYKHNGRFRRNGIVKHDSNIRILLED